MENSSKFENAQFVALVASVRRVMPTLAAVLLITVYAISAAAAGMFLSGKTLLGGISGGVALAYFVGAAIQATRGLLVFFGQLNPSRPTLSNAGEVLAVVFGALSIFEIYHLSSAAGMGFPVVVSMSILMLAGVGIEIYLLQEVRFLTELRLFQDSGYWAQIEGYYQAKRDFKDKIEALRTGKRISVSTNFQNPVRQAQTIPGKLSANGQAVHLNTF